MSGNYLLMDNIYCCVHLVQLSEIFSFTNSSTKLVVKIMPGIEKLNC